MKIKIPTLHPAPHPDFDQAAGPTWILSLPAISQAALVEVHDRYPAHSIT